MLAACLSAGALITAASLWARGPAGGGRAGGGGGGGGGARPSMGPSSGRPAGNVSRPQAPAAARPPVAQRPSFSNAGGAAHARPAQPESRPALGISRPEGNASRPVTRPNVTERPSTLPAAGNRPSFGNINRPEGGNRPAIADRPVTLPARPETGGNRPGIADRPGTLPARPGTGSDRPMIGGNRPGTGNRPIIGGNGNTVIGGHNVNVNRPAINNNFYGNRAGWGYGPRPGYGGWANHWYNHNINYHHHGWYHGCWNGHWANHWYVPLVYGVTAWGLAATLPAWGYGYAYANPYYQPAAVEQTVYNYSQPLVLDSYDSDQTEVADSSPPQETPAQAQAYGPFDQAVEAFKDQEYRKALTLDEQAIRSLPHDPALHEFSALCSFALGDYQQAAAVLNALLAAAPGMDWQSMSSLYADIDTYTAQLRALEKYRMQHPDDAAARFVLAYHYLVAGHNEAAIGELKAVVAKQPNDQVAKRMLDALNPPAEAEAAAPANENPAPVAAADTQPTTDLVGRWQAKHAKDTFELTIDEKNQFAWKATTEGKPPTTISGPMAVAGDALVLESQQQGTMVGRVTSRGPDRFSFAVNGAPPSDEGLTFDRVKGG